jgi:molybdopterin-guanine dinucleotide biosynthesis protein A
MSVSTDTPFLPDNLADVLQAGAQGRPAIAASAERLHPVVGLWPLTLRADLQQALDSGCLSVEKFAQAIRAIAVPFALRTIGTVTLDPFFNANTPGELAEAEAIVAHVNKAGALGRFP